MPGMQEALALLIVAVVAGAVLFRRLRARRAKKRVREASVSPDDIARRRNRAPPDEARSD
ncbi:MAG: hypothetical protein OXE51_09955 [Gammaproteobacteria bacterium]|nr:hypothetical protein [Gammaproteobacteria bacterium]